MRTPASHALPVVVIASIAGWQTWNYSETPPKPGASKSKVEKIDGGLLEPKIGDASARDPFTLPVPKTEKPPTAVAAAGKAATKGASSADAKSDKSASTRNKPRFEYVKTLANRVSGYVKQKVNEANAKAKDAAMARAEVVEKVRLTATLLGGQRPLATMNDRTFMEGEVIDSLAGLSGPVKLMSVGRRTATLRYKNTFAVLNFKPSDSAPVDRPMPKAKAPTPAKAATNNAAKTRSTRRPTGGRS